MACIVPADLLSEGGRDIVFGQPTDYWKAQRQLVHDAIR